MSTDPSSGVPGEVQARLTALAEAAREGGTTVLPPLLILGTCERVGSNWLSDTLRPLTGQHNEPFRQQTGADHPSTSGRSRYVTKRQRCERETAGRKSPTRKSMVSGPGPMAGVEWSK